MSVHDRAKSKIPGPKTKKNPRYDCRIHLDVRLERRNLIVLIAVGVRESVAPSAGNIIARKTYRSRAIRVRVSFGCARYICEWP
jgi:hypothetical protein